jgi:heptosyltransferase-2
MSESPGTEPRILVIRGGAIGDFILTLPAIRLLRDNFPAARLEILGYKHIVALAEGRFYAEATRSIEYGPVAAFFARNANLDAELSAYFGGFHQVVSYLFDPDGIFEANLRRAGVKNFLYAYRKLDDSDHAAHQLARPLEQLALYLDDAAARIHPSEEDRAAAARFLGEAAAHPLVAIHPGSGSSTKNWPVEHWLELRSKLQLEFPEARFLIIGGEADDDQIAAFLTRSEEAPSLVARALPLPELAAILERCRLYLGHDTGISHLAAAVGLPCVLLFGPTDPDVWKPVSQKVTVLRAPTGELGEVAVRTVLEAAGAVLRNDRKTLSE